MFSFSPIREYTEINLSVEAGSARRLTMEGEIQCLEEAEPPA
jgi:hypothetical protein